MKFKALLINSIATLSGLITIVNEMKGQSRQFVFNILIGSFILLVFVNIVIWVVSRHLQKIGVRGEPLKFTLYLKRFNPRIMYNFILGLHSFHHELFQCKQKIFTYPISSPLSREGKDMTAHLLSHCHDIIRTLTGISFSINIKLFERLDNHASGSSNLDEAVLVTYERFPSIDEKKSFQSDKPGRKNNEKFLVEAWSNDNVEEIYKNCLKARDGFRKNYAYDFVLGPSKHYWLSNNLKKDDKRKCFFSSSKNYDQFYNSLAVFLISPPLDHSLKPSKEETFGLLIFDTIHSNVFDKELSRQLLGYFAHRFYEYFSYFQLPNSNS